MEPFFFGHSSSPLYGVYHPPNASQYRAEAVLLCYPAGQEYMRIHRAYRQLASMLAQAGFHVLRFDYSGTGDSFGNFDSVTHQQWIDDALLAAEELKVLAGVDRLLGVGTRIGSTVITDLSFRTPIKKIALWEPIPDNSEFFAELLSTIDKAPCLSNFRDSEGGFHFNGFHFTKKYCDSFREQKITQLPWNQSSSAILLITANPSPPVERLHQYLSLKEVKSELKEVSCLADWNKLDALGGLFLPQNTLHVIVNWLSANP